MRSLRGQIGRVGQHEGNAIDVPLHGPQGDRIEKIDVECFFPKCEQRADSFFFVSVFLPPGSTVFVDDVRNFAGRDTDRVGQQAAEMLDEIANGFGEVLRHLLFAGQTDLRADRQFSFDRFQSVGSIRFGTPFQRQAPFRGLRENDNLVGDDETGKNTDAKLANEVGALAKLFGLFRAFSDRSQKTMHLLFGQTDSIIGKDDGRRFAARRVDFEVDFTNVLRIELPPGAYGIHTILKQFADEDFRAAIEVVG